MKECIPRFLHMLTPKILFIDGDCKTGTDAIAKNIAKEWGFDRKPFPADWVTHGRSAGPIRNAAMAKIGTHCLAFWDGESPGTRDMIFKAIAAKIETTIFPY